MKNDSVVAGIIYVVWQKQLSDTVLFSGSTASISAICGIKSKPWPYMYHTFVVRQWYSLIKILKDGI